MNTITRLILILLAAALTGCATRGEVNDFASITAANISVVNSSLTAFADDSRGLTAQRARTMQALSNQLDRSERQLAEDYIVLDRVGRAGAYEELERLLDRSREIRLPDRVEQNRDLLDAILAAQADLSTPDKPLRDISRTLGALGGESSSTDRVRFFVRFASQVADDMKQARELQLQSSGDAERRIVGAGGADALGDADDSE